MRYADVRMPYLERRIEKLLSDYKAAKLILRADSTELRADLDAIVVDERGRLDLSTCSDRVRSYARAYWGHQRFRRGATPSGATVSGRQAGSATCDCEGPRRRTQRILCSSRGRLHRVHWQHPGEVCGCSWGEGRSQGASRAGQIIRGDPRARTSTEHLAVKEADRFADIVSKNHLFVPPEAMAVNRSRMRFASTWSMRARGDRRTESKN
jgi:hypothetical protein